MRVVITGSSGMIGTALAEELQRLGHTVVGVDRHPNGWQPWLEALTIQVDLRDQAALLARVPGEVDAVVHLAANARVHDLVVDPNLARDNFETTFNTLEYARLRKVPRVIIASSREVYGTTEEAHHAEGDASIELSASPYAACKLGTEALGASYLHCYGIGVTVLRFSNVYGRYDTSDRVIPKFIGAASRHEDLTVFGEDKLLDFTYLDDTVRGIMLALDKPAAARGKTFNIASGTGSTLVELAHQLRRLLDSRSRLNIGDNRTGEVVKYIADISHARAQLGYAPQISFGDGLRLTIDWYRTHGLV